MTTAIPQVTDTNEINHFINIDLTLGNTTYYISTNRRPISAISPTTFTEQTYQALGWALQISSITDDLKTNNGDLQISLSGIPDGLVSQVLNNEVKGGKVVITRWITKDDYYAATQSIQGYRRYTGIVSNFVIEEDDSFLDRTRTYTCSITCANINTLMENRISGQRTNKSDRQKFYPGDISFNRVADLMNTSFDFGKKYTGGTGYGNQYAPGFGGGGGFGPGGRFFDDFNFQER
jgi:hypothetical protein